MMSEVFIYVASKQLFTSQVSKEALFTILKSYRSLIVV